MGGWHSDEHFAGYEVWESVSPEDWPGSGVEPCRCGARTHWVIRKLFNLEPGDTNERIGGKLRVYRYNVIHGDRAGGHSGTAVERRDVEDRKRRASGEAA